MEYFVASQKGNSIYVWTITYIIATKVAIHINPFITSSFMLSKFVGESCFVCNVNPADSVSSLKVGKDDQAEELPGLSS